MRPVTARTLHEVEVDAAWLEYELSKSAAAGESISLQHPAVVEFIGRQRLRVLLLDAQIKTEEIATFVFGTLEDIDRLELTQEEDPP